MALPRGFFLALATIQILFLSSAISTSTTEFPITQVAYWTQADSCVRSCATAATSQYAAAPSCSSSNALECVCQDPIAPANSARQCALLSCSAPANDPDIVGIQGKEIILQLCSSNHLPTSTPSAASQTAAPLSTPATSTTTSPSPSSTPSESSPTTSTTGSTSSPIMSSTASPRTSPTASPTTSPTTDSKASTGTRVSADQSLRSSSSAVSTTTSAASGLSRTGKILLGVLLPVFCTAIIGVIALLVLWKRRQGRTRDDDQHKHINIRGDGESKGDNESVSGLSLHGSTQPHENSTQPSDWDGRPVTIAPASCDII